MSDRESQLVEIVDVLSVIFFVTAGAFIVAAVLVQMQGGDGSVEDSLRLTGIGLGGLGALTRWLLSRYG